ncbi:MAG: TIGR01777 family protein [Flavobacteriaceae bacterium]|nr:TIGR01777 family protein [Flavobacteriaceae bacterium]
MTILITGATGLVGKALVSSLLEKGHTIHYLTTSKHKIKTEEHLKGFYWNPVKEEINDNCIDGVEIIIHLAGANVSKRWTRKYKQEIWDSRTLSTQLLVKLLKLSCHKVKHLVNASAIGIYKDSLTEIYSEESTVYSTSFLGRVVQAWEEATEAVSNLSIPVSKMRIGIVLSEDGGALQKMSQPIKMGLGAKFGHGKQWQSWIHIDDLVNSILYVIENKLDGTINAVAPNPVTNQELTKAIAKHYKKPLFLPGVPKFMMQLILGEMHTILFESQKVSPERLKDSGFKFRYNFIQDIFE